MNSFVSIIIPVRNEEANLSRVLRSLEELDYPGNKYEIIIVDGLSTDKTVAIAKSFKTVILSNKRKIRGVGCQLGIEKSKGDFIAFTDADCVVPKNWLKGLVKYFNDKRVASVGGPNVTPRDDTPFAKATGEALWLLTRAGARYGLSSHKVVEIFHNPGCNVVYRKQAVQEVGGFNSNLITCEDEELDYRIREKGYKILFTPEIIVDHYRRPTYKKIYIQAYRFAIGRVQAMKVHWRMARWFHFGPPLLVLSLLMVFGVVFVFPGFEILGLLYILTVFLLFLVASWYLVFSRETAPFYVYLLVLLCWFFGWGLGFFKGIFWPISSVFRGQESIKRKKKTEFEYRE